MSILSKWKIHFNKRAIFPNTHEALASLLLASPFAKVVAAQIRYAACFTRTCQSRRCTDSRYCLLHPYLPKSSLYIFAILLVSPFAKAVVAQIRVTTCFTLCLSCCCTDSCNESSKLYSVFLSLIHI